MSRPVSIEYKKDAPRYLVPPRTRWRFFAAAIMLSAMITQGETAMAGGLPEPEAALPDFDFARQAGDQDWAGFFMGASLGYGFGDMSVNGDVGNFDFDTDGTFASLYLGYDWQFGNFLLGFEGEWGAGDVSGSGGSGGTNFSTDLNWLTAIRARAGVLLNPALLIYATGGWAWADMDLKGTGVGAFDTSENLSGYQVGGGAEYRFSQTWALRLDYVYTDLEDETISAGGVNNTFDPEFHLARAALTLRF